MKTIRLIIIAMLSAIILVSCGSRKNHNTPFLGELLGKDADTITEEDIDGVSSILIAGNHASLNRMENIPFGKDGYSWKGSVAGWDEQYGTELKELDVFQNVTELSILYNSSLDDIGFVSKMKHLKKLKIHMGAFSDISTLKSCQELEDLEIVGVTNLKDISAVGELTNLKRLKISGCSVEDLEPVSGLTHLEELIVTYNCTDIANIDSLGKLNGVTTLYLICPNIDISFLRDSGIRPQILSIGGGKIDLSVLSGIKGLNILNIEETEIGDLSPLADSDIPSISLYNCTVSSDNDIDERIDVSEGLSHYDYFWLLG